MAHWFLAPPTILRFTAQNFGIQQEREEKRERENEEKKRPIPNSPALFLSFSTSYRFSILFGEALNMNEKAAVSKDLNAKHTKILEGLLKLPENRECADCRSRSPRWASINLGIFICMQCSGIHRSLGVHISKVRSTTLDTWLPDQIAFMQSTGNEKANSYWEALLPPDSDRSDIEKFIRAKYQERKWASKDIVQPINMVSGKHSNCHKPTEGGVRIPRKARKYSLEEEILDTDMSKVASTTRPRWGSVDMTDQLIIEPPPNDASIEQQASRMSDTAKDLFSLLYAPEVKQDRVVVPPSRWATFECKNTVSCRGDDASKKELMELNSKMLLD